MAIVSMSIAIVSIGSISSGLSISRPLAIVVAIVVGIWVCMVSIGVGIAMMSIAKMSIAMVAIAKVVAIAIVAIEDTSISTCFSFTSSSGEHTQGNNSNGFHHFECLQARGFS